MVHGTDSTLVWLRMAELHNQAKRREGRIYIMYGIRNVFIMFINIQLAWLMRMGW